MRRKRSGELPRFIEAAELRSFHWRRRYTYYLLGFVFVCWLLYPSSSALAQDGDVLSINWSNYAYSLHATDDATLCHAVLLFDALAGFGSKADRVLFYPEYWDTKVESSKDRESQLLLLARDKYKVKLQPVKPLIVEGRTKGKGLLISAIITVRRDRCKGLANDLAGKWTGASDKSVTKLMAFSLEYYDRVIALDSDITLLQSLDELFLLPETPIAMPRAYLTDSRPWPLSSVLMVIKPSLKELEKFKSIIGLGGNDMLVNANRFDMELVNERFEDSAMVLPHRPYALITGEFRRHDHAAYLGNPDETWDAEKVLKEAKLVQFSDSPLPKPWVLWPLKGLEAMQPDCGGSLEGTCAERRIWKHLYDDFRHRRRDICKLLSVLAPDWEEIKEQGQPRNATIGTEHAAPQADGTASSSAATLVAS